MFNLLLAVLGLCCFANFVLGPWWAGTALYAQCVGFSLCWLLLAELRLHVYRLQ